MGSCSIEVLYSGQGLHSTESNECGQKNFYLLRFLRQPIITSDPNSAGQDSDQQDTQFSAHIKSFTPHSLKSGKPHDYYLDISPSQLDDGGIQLILGPRDYIAIDDITHGKNVLRKHYFRVPTT
jgi:hypothetical protein